MANLGILINESLVDNAVILDAGNVVDVCIAGKKLRSSVTFSDELQSLTDN